MKCLTDRYEIAKALNFNKYPVLNLDLATSEYNEEYFKGCYHGQQVRWLSRTENGTNYYWHGQLCYFKDTALVITNDSACLTASFGYRDIVEDMELANAPIVEANKEVIVIIHDSKKRVAMVVKTMINGISKHQTPAITFESGFKQIIKMVEDYKSKED